MSYDEAWGRCSSAELWDAKVAYWNTHETTGTKEGLDRYMTQACSNWPPRRGCGGCRHKCGRSRASGWNDWAPCAACAAQVFRWWRGRRPPMGDYQDIQKGIGAGAQVLNVIQAIPGVGQVAGLLSDVVGAFGIAGEQAAYNRMIWNRYATPVQQGGWLYTGSANPVVRVLNAQARANAIRAKRGGLGGWSPWLYLSWLRRLRRR